MIGDKSCPTCKEVKAVFDFSKSSSTKDGLNYQCIPCHKTRMRRQRSFNSVRPKLQADQKRCSKCRDVKKVDEFNKNRVTADGFNNVCRVCESEYRVKRESMYAESNKSGLPMVEVSELRCCKCKVTQPAIQFSTSVRTKTGLKRSCKTCDAVSQARRASTKSGKLYSLVNGAKQRAAQKGMVFNLSVEDLSIPDFCPVLGIPIVVGGRRGDNSPSLDRKENDRGYTKGNVVVVSMRANRLKSDATTEELAKLALFYQSQSSS